jgi:hypothetical protein
MKAALEALIRELEKPQAEYTEAQRAYYAAKRDIAKRIRAILEEERDE